MADAMQKRRTDYGPPHYEQFLPPIVKENYGYLTENSGTATIPAGSTRVTVEHGLVSAPTKVLVTPKANIGAVWVENITDTSFVIVCETAPASDVEVMWYAEV